MMTSTSHLQMCKRKRQALSTAVMIMAGLFSQFYLVPAIAEIKTDFGVYPEPPLQLPLTQGRVKDH